MQGFVFDYYNQLEVPPIYLANPDGQILYNLGTIYERKFELRYNAQSTFTFCAPAKVDGIDTDYYDSIKYRRLIYVDDIATFMITGIKITNDGIKEIKEVTCKSLEVVFAYKKVTTFEGTYNFYDPYNPTGTLLTEIMSYVPGWTLGTIDSSLYNIYRTFAVSDKTLYDFVVNEVSPTYQCVFVFDSINKTLSVYSIANATSSTDIFISFDNLLESFNIDESTDELCTALTVLGGEDLAINLVNPLGNNIIYNFDYYKTTEWMTQDLIDALNVWEDKIDFYQPTYANLLTNLRVENETLLTLQSELATLEGELAALQVTRDARIEQGLDVTSINADIASQQALITAKEAEITTQQSVITSIQYQLTAINTDLSFDNNFTDDQLSDLNNFVIGNTYTNTNFIQTSVMTETEVQEQAQSLYDEAVIVLAKISQPRYTYDVSTANFLYMQEFSQYIDQLALGSTVTVELKPGTLSYPALLGIDFNFDNPEDFGLVLSNRLRLDDSSFKYSDLYGSTVDSGVTTNFNSQKWNTTSAYYSGIVNSASNIVLSSTTSQTNNIPVYSDTSGAILKDVNAKYTAPSTFTPTLVSEGATYTYNYNAGYYSVTGRTCSFELSLSIASITGTSASPVYMTLPLTSKEVTNVQASFPIQHQNVTLGSGYTSVIGLLGSSTNKLYLYQQGSGKAHSAITYSMLSASPTILHATGIYLID